MSKNILNIIIVYIGMIAIYAAWAFQYFITFDSEGLYLNTASIINNQWYSQWIALGRWGFVLLKKILGVAAINPFFSTGIFLSLFPLSIIIWNYIFEIWGFKSKNKICKVLLEILYLSHPVWALQFSYRNQIEVLTIIALILPISTYYLINGINNKKIFDCIVASIGIIVSFAGYQSYVFMYVLVIAIYFFINVFNNKFNTKEFYEKLLKIGAVSLILFILYLISMKCVSYLCGQHLANSYFSSQFMWKTKGIKECVLVIISSLRQAFLGDKMLFTCLYAIEFIVGIPMIIIQIRKMKDLNSKIWLPIIYVGLFLLPFILCICTGNTVVIRQQFSFILAFAFIGCFEVVYYLDNFEIITKNKFIKLIAVLLISYALLIQMQMNTRLLYSDYFVMFNDYEKMEAIYNTAIEKGAKEYDAIVFVGGQSNAVTEPVVENEVIGFSYFEVVPIAQSKIIEAMIGYGFKVSLPTNEQYIQAKEEVKEMTNYPSSDSIKIDNGLIVVKLSD